MDSTPNSQGNHQPAFTSDPSTYEVIGEGYLVFFSYTSRDQALRDRLDDHLTNLKYRRLVTTWHIKQVSAGQPLLEEIDRYLKSADIILLLISASYLASDYCNSREMAYALERHDRGEARVLPILLRPVQFTNAPFAKLKALPQNGKPVTSWRDRDLAFVDIALEIERLINLWNVARGETKILLSRDSGEDQPTPQTSSELVGGWQSDSTGWHRDIDDWLADPEYRTKGIPLWLRSKPVEEIDRQRYYMENIRAYEKAFTGNLSDIAVYNGAGSALVGQGKYDQAMRVYEKALALQANPTSYIGIGDAYLKRKVYHSAVMAYREALQLDVTAALAYEGLYAALMKLKKRQEGKAVVQQAEALGYEVE
jgi:tetratricopeptide (TPR) repeat protein